MKGRVRDGGKSQILSTLIEDKESGLGSALVTLDHTSGLRPRSSLNIFFCKGHSKVSVWVSYVCTKAYLCKQMQEIQPKLFM